MSGAFEQVVQHCWKRKKMSKACWKYVESNLNWFQLSFNIASIFPLFLKMLNGDETVWTLRSSNICPTSVHLLLKECWANVETLKHMHSHRLAFLLPSFHQALSSHARSRLCDGRLKWCWPRKLPARESLRQGCIRQVHHHQAPVPHRSYHLRQPAITENAVQTIQLHIW